jgi:hypothetical protein
MPPSVFTGDMALWLRELWEVVNYSPRQSFFSGVTPNSSVTGYPGDVAVNLASGSTTTRLWQLGGDPKSGITTLGWRPLQLGPA